MVVRSQDEASVGEIDIALEGVIPLARQNAGCDAVVAGIRLRLGIVEAVAGVRVDVRATNQLHTEGEAALMSLLQVAGQDLGGALLVGLVGAEDNSVAGVPVVLASIVESPVIDTILQGVLLGIEQETDSALRSRRADAINGVCQVLGARQTLGQSVESNASSTSEPTAGLVFS